MLDRLGLGEIEDFPEATFFLSALILAVFLFTRMDLAYFENVFGFIPAHPQIYAFLTYTFIHVDFVHVFFNLVFLLIAGIAIEETLGKWVFLSVYFSSGNIAVIFDILGRFLSGISFSVPFVGASGAIFGVMAIAALIKSSEKVPTILALLAFLPLIQWSLSSYSQFDYLTTLLVTTTTGIIFLFIVFFIPSAVPVSLAMILFLISWLVVILLRLPTQVSNLGHLGGVVGGIISVFLFGNMAKGKKRF
ncbi:MAG TPA: rhomboid family intramembrane serine protease [archaeon]|nr:rhomboid family intramembrane serine protease [archaeon]